MTRKVVGAKPTSHPKGEVGKIENSASPYDSKVSSYRSFRLMARHLSYAQSMTVRFGQGARLCSSIGENIGLRNRMLQVRVLSGALWRMYVIGKRSSLGRRVSRMGFGVRLSGFPPLENVRYRQAQPVPKTGGGSDAAWEFDSPVFRHIFLMQPQ